MALSEKLVASHGRSRIYAGASYALELTVVGLIYVALAKIGLMLASIHPSASPIWPCTGLALAALILRGYRVWPAILVAAFVANVTTAGSVATSLAIGAGNTFEALLGAYLIKRLSDGKATFESPAGVTRFALLAFLPTALCATIGVTSLAAGGLVDRAAIGSVWLTWWLGDLAGALLVTPVIVLWAGADFRRVSWPKLFESIVIFCVACIIGLIAFSPIFGSTERRVPLGFLAVLPLLWSALRRGPRDTALSTLVLAAFAVWGTFAGSGPFGRETLNESFLLLLTFMIGVTVPSLALSADAAVRRRTEDELRTVHDDLNRRVASRTADLTDANLALQDEIDRRKRAETVLDEQTRHLVEAQRLANLGSWVRNLETNEIVWSDQLYEIFGVQRGQENSGSFDGYLQRIHPEDRERVSKQVQAAIKAGEDFRGERRIVRPNGEIRYVQTCVEVMKNDEGDVIGMHGICFDVTDRKQAELALERTREQLSQMQKMEALGQLTGGIAHDFNNLLMIVSGHAELLRRKLTDPNQLRAIEAIMGAGHRGERLTRQLLTFSRRQPLNPVPIDLSQRVQELRPMLNSSLRGNITLAIDLGDDLWPVEADIAEFELAMVNVAVNARDAMLDGGTFTISARNVPAGQGGAGHPSVDHVVVSFTDTGIGIPQDTVKKIFDPFFTTKAVGKGTGLGLSQVYGFAHQSGGTVSVTSELGRGTTISLYLARCNAAAMAEPQLNDPKNVGVAEGTILVVEDNPEVADVSATLLEQIGYHVLRAGNAIEALERIEGGDRIDLVFSDIVMPNGMNGIHLAQELTERYPTIRVLLTTGYSDVAAAGETRFPILRKPFELPALEQAIRDVMAGHEARPRRAVGRVGH
ncbi:MAG TPA: MASE1 domain-containing protein [Xanthobacteraceae bacterium]|nr:MASE1 domain-containing protein [Xanthobacteraceae bacterium]